MKKFLLLCISILQVAFVPLFAQHTLSGTLLSKTDGAPIEMATVRLFSYHHIPGVNPETGKPLLDSTLVQGAQTTYDGLFVLTNIPQGKYRLIISSVGFAEMTKEIDMPNHNLDIPARAGATSCRSQRPRQGRGDDRQGRYHRVQYCCLPS